MKFGKRYSRVTVLMAMLQGVLIGVAAVAIIFFILNGTGGKKAEDTTKEQEKLPITGPATSDTETPLPIAHEPIHLFARQYGVFTTPISAATFIAENPSLSSAAVIKAEGQYYVWTAVGLSEADIMDSENGETFRKRLTADTSACSALGAGSLINVLRSTDASKINISDDKTEGVLTAEFDRNIAAITAFTNDMRVIRLQLLSQYSYTKECIKITF